MRTTRAATLSRIDGGAVCTVDSMAASSPRWAAMLSRSASIQVASASRRPVTRREVLGWRAERRVQPTAPPMAAPTGQRVTSPTIRASVDRADGGLPVGRVQPLDHRHAPDRGTGRPETRR